MLTVLAKRLLKIEKKNGLTIVPCSFYHHTLPLATVTRWTVFNPTVHQPAHKCIFTTRKPHSRPNRLLLLIHPIWNIWSNLGFPSRAVPSQFQWVHTLSRVWVNIIMCDLRFCFSEKTNSWKFLKKEIETQGQVVKMWRIVDANVLSGNFLKGFYCLWLYILLITEIKTNNLLFSLADDLNEGTKGSSVQHAPSGNSSGHIHPSPAHLKVQLILDQSWRIWQQQKVLTTAMKGLLNPSTTRIEMLLPLLLFARHPCQVRPFK